MKGKKIFLALLLAGCWGHNSLAVVTETVSTETNGDPTPAVITTTADSTTGETTSQVAGGTQTTGPGGRCSFQPPKGGTGTGGCYPSPYCNRGETVEQCRARQERERAACPQ